jgi:hypothetical protein
MRPFPGILVLLLSPLMVLSSPPALEPVGQVVVGGAVAPDHVTEVQCDVPSGERLHNIGSHVDGAGMCVMSSIEMALRYQGLDDLRGLRDWCAQSAGGAYPSKVDQQIPAYCKQKNVPVPEYGQAERDSLATIKAILATGRIACVTYDGHDGVRYRGKIAHMVCVVHCDEKFVCLLDNNAVGENELLWMSPEDFQTRFQGGGGWVFFWLAPAPPPCPRN